MNRGNQFISKAALSVAAILVSKKSLSASIQTHAVTFVDAIQEFAGDPF